MSRMGSGVLGYVLGRSDRDGGHYPVDDIGRQNIIVRELIKTVVGDAKISAKYKRLYPT